MTAQQVSDRDERLNARIRSVPPALYRFTSLRRDGQEDRLAWLRTLVLDSRLHFASPSCFNDPFDCRSFEMRFEASRLRREAHWRQAATGMKASRKERLRRIQQLVRMSETTEGRERLKVQIFESLQQNGMVCFAPDPTDTLLWSYYADGHRGIAVRFDTSLELLLRFDAPFLPVQVAYQESFPQVNYYTAERDEFTFTILGTKSTAWQHEREWRFVLPGRVGYFVIPRPMVTGLIFGMRTPQNVETEVREWNARRNPPAELLRVVNRSDSYQLEIVPA